jgi:hypothetical protein
MQARILLLIFFSLQVPSAFAQPVEKLLLTTTKQWYYPGERVWFVVNTFDACRNRLAQLSGIAYVELVDADAQPVYRSKVIVENAEAKGSIFIGDNITSGTYTLVAYTNWMKNFGPEIFVRKPIQIVNPAKPAKVSTSHQLSAQQSETTATVTLSMSDKQFKRREPVTINCSVGKPARFSVAVYRTDELENGTETFYMSAVRDSCNAIISQKAPYIFERRGHIVSGKVINRQTQQPARGIRGYLSVTAYPDRLYMAVSDSTGTIRFDIGELTGATELVLQTEPSGKNRYIIELADPFADNVAGLSQKGDIDVFASNPQVVDETLVSAQVQNIFANSDSSSLAPVTTKTFYGKPDGFYLMANYKHFNTVEEILREYVANVGVQKRGNKLYPVVFDLKTMKRFPQPPLILVNGVPFFDGDRFMKMNTDEFHSIAVVAGRYFMGNQAFYGIIDVRLNTALKEFAPDARVIEYDCLQPRSEFVSPVYDDESKRLSRKPDFRNVLYWNPHIETDSDGNASVEFYTSDLAGGFVVVVKAIAKDGQLSLGKSLITVK